MQTSACDGFQLNDGSHWCTVRTAEWGGLLLEPLQSMLQIDWRTDHSLSLFIFCAAESPGSSRQYDLPDSGLSSFWRSKMWLYSVKSRQKKINKYIVRVASWTPLLVLTANCSESIRCSAAFRDRWTFSYIFTEVKGPAVCLQCWQHESIPKENNLCHRYETLHADKCENPEGQQWIEKVCELLPALKKQQSVVTRFKMRRLRALKSVGLL